MVLYECHLCGLSTADKTDFSKHLKTKKHARNKAEHDKYLKSHSKCKYCDKFFSKRRVNEHMSRCPSAKYANLPDDLKKEYNEMKEKIKNLERQNMYNEKLIEAQKLEIKQLYDYIDNMIKNLSVQEEVGEEKIIVEILLTGNAKKVIDNVPGTVINIEDIPKLTDNEKKFIINMGPIEGAKKILIERFVNNDDINAKPFYCTDIRRNMFLTKTNGKWRYDQDGKVIEKYLSKLILDYVNDNFNLIVNNIDNSNNSIDEIKQITDSFFNLKSDYNKYVLFKLKKLVSVNKMFK